MNKVTSYYPVICSQNGVALVQFLQHNLDFAIIYSSAWYWHLSMNNQPNVNIAIVDCKHPSVPESLRTPVQGLLINIEIEDIRAYYADNENRDWQIQLPLRDEPWGQRHFIISTPEPGVMIDIIEVIAASDEYAENYNASTSS